MKKRLLALSLCLILILCIGSIQMVGATEDEDKKVSDFLASSNITIDDAANIATKFIESTTGKNLHSGSVTNLYDLDNNITGYCISLWKNQNGIQKPSGYVIIDKLVKENPIVEFSTEGDSLIDDLNSYTKVYTGKTSLNEKTYFLGAGQFYSEILDNNEKVLFSPDKRLIEKKNSFYSKAKTIIKNKVKKLKGKNAILGSTTTGGGIYDNKPSGGTDANEKTLPGVYIYEYKTMSELGPGEVCTPTAATNVMIYWKTAQGMTNIYKNGSIQSTFNELSSLMGTNPSTGTYGSKIKGALQNYIKQRGYKPKVDEYWLDLYSDFTRDIKAHKPVLTGVVADNGGHSVVTVGYLDKRFGAVTYQWLKVIDSWHKSIRYMSLNDYYSDIDGWAVSMTV